MKKLITSIAVAGILLKVLFNTNDLMTRIVVIPFLVFAVTLGVKNALIMMNKRDLEVKVSKVYVVAFLIYWDYASLIDGNYMKVLYSVPFWLEGIYFTYKRLFRQT